MASDIETTKLHIKVAIQDLQEKGFDLVLLAYCGVFDVELDLVRSTSLGDAIICAIQRMLGEESDEEMLAAVLEATQGMIDNSMVNLQTICDYQSMLSSKQRSLISRNVYGDIDEQKWADFASKFSVDKLKGYAPLKWYVEFRASHEARQRLRQVGLLDMFGVYTRQMLFLLKHFSREDSASPATGEEYEELLKQQISDRFPGAYVESTPKSGDQGVDLIVDIDEIRIAIQAKYFKSSVGNAAVQEVHAGKGYCQADYAMVVCDSDFTRHAIELAEKLGVCLETTQTYLNRIETILDR